MRIGQVGGLIDVTPTLLQLLGVPKPPSMLGRSLLDASPGFFADPAGRVLTAELLWTGGECYARSDGGKRPATACDALRARARQELEASWLITRYDLSRRLDNGGSKGARDAGAVK